MPNAIITAIMFVGNLVMTALPIIEVVFGISGTTFFVTGALAITAGVVGMSKLMEMSIPRPDSNYARQKTVRSTTAPVKRVYGESLISGPVAFMGVGGTGNQDLWHVIALTGDKSEAITDIYLDNIIIPNADINSGNALGGAVNGTTTIFKPIDSTTLVTVYKYTGGQTAVSQPVANEFFKWTSDHEGQGLTYIATKFSFPDNEKIAEIWNKYNPQDIKALVKGMAIYDPRKDSTSPEYDSSLGVSTHRLSDSTTWQWSDNPALCLANYVIDDQFGMGVPSSAIDWASVHSSADYSDALVSIPNSQTQKRFTCNGVLYGTDSHSQNINKILSSMNGSLVYSSGKYVMQAGQYIEPESDAILTDNDLNGPINITVANTRDDRFNTIKGTHFNPEDLHKKVAFPEVQLTDILTRDAGEVLYKEVELPMTNDVYMCQRLTYQMINRSNDQLLIEFPCNLKALRYTVGDRVKITLDKFAGSDQDSISFNQTPFVILGFNFSAEGAVTLTMLKDTEANYTDMPAGNYSQIASDGSITDGFSGVPAPTNLGSVVDGHFVRLTWDNPVPNTTFNDIIVYQSSTSNFSESSILLRTKNDAITFSLPSSALTKYYWVRASLYDNEVAATDIIIGQTYRIRSLGTTSWTTLGATAPVSNGDTFLATASGTSSSGTGIATDESAVSAVVGPETVTTTDQVADSVEWVDVDDTAGRRPSDNATVGATLGTDVYDGQAQAYAVGDLLNSNGFFRFTRTSADDNVDAPANAAAFNTAFGRAPTDGDIVVVTNTTSSPNKQAAYQYDGSTFGTISGFFAGDLIIDDTITAAALSVDDLGAINSNLGTITGGTLKGGTIPDADAAPSGTESGSFFDLTDGKFVVGNATNNILFDSSALTVTGTVNASAGAFTGDVSTGAKFIAGSNSSTVTLDGNATANYSIFAGAEQATDASFRVASDGVVEATRFIIRDDANGQVLIDTSNTANPFSGIVYTSISQGSGAGVDTVAGDLDNDADEITITTTQAETFLITTKVAIDDNNSELNNIGGASTSSAADAISQLTATQLRVEYYLKEGSGSYAEEDVETISFTTGIPSSSQIKVLGLDRGAGYGGSLTRYFAIVLGGGAAELATYYNTAAGANRARTYAVTTASISISQAGTHKIKVLAKLVLSGTSTVISTATTPPLSNNQSTGVVLDPDQSPLNQSSLENFRRLYEMTSANGFVASPTDDTFAIGEGTTILTSGGTISGDLVITGDLTVQGTTTTINVADLTVADKDITLNYSTGDSSSTANNAGIIIQDAVDATTDASILWKTASDTFEFSHGVVTPTLVSGDIDIGDGTAREELKIKSSSYAEVQYFIKHAQNSNVLTEYIRAGVSVTESSYNQVIGDYFLFSVPNSKMLLTVPVNGDPLKRNNGAITIIDSTNYGTYALPLSGGTLTGALSGTTGTFTGAVSGASFELSGISVIDSSQNINAASISTSGITSSGDITLTSTATSSPSVTFNSSTATDPAVDMAIKLVGEELHFYEPEDTDKVHFKIYDDTGVDAPFGYWVNGTRMADASRNLTVGTISSGAITATSDLFLRSAGGEAGIYLQDSSASNATAFKIYADVTLATSTLYIDHDPSVAGGNWAFVNGGNFLASGTIYADGAASNSLQWEAGYDYSQVGHLPLAGGTLSGNLLTTGTLQFDVGTGTDKSDIIQAANFPSESFTASTQKYWLEYKAKGGHHFVVNTDGGSTASENTFDHFTVWQGAIDGMQLFRLTNTGNATLRQKLTTTGLVSSTTGSTYSSGTVAAIFKDTTARGTVRIRSDADAAAELFFDVNGAAAWDISARQSTEDYDLHFYGRANTPSLTAVGGPFFTITQAGFADALAGFKVNDVTVIDSSRNLTAVTGTFSGVVYAGTRVEINGGSAWAYTRLKDSGGVKWDIASNANDNSSALQFRPFGSGTNSTRMSTAGHWTMAGNITAGGAISGASFELSGISVIDSSQNINAASISTDAITSAGDITLTSTTTSSPSINFNSSTATDPAVDMAVKLVGEDLHFYEPEDSDKVHFKILDDTGVDAPYGYWVNGTRIVDSSRNLTAANGNFSGIVGVNKATNSAVGLSVGSDASTATSYGLEVCNSTSNTRFIVDGLGNSTFYQSDNTVGMSVTSGGNVDINSGALKMGGTTVISSGRNLANIGSYTGSGQILITGPSIPIKVTGTSASAYAELQVYNDNGAGLIIGSIGSTYSNAAFAGSRYIYSTSGEFRIKSAGALKLYSGGTGDTGDLAVTFDTSRNATFAGTISSGAITSTGSIISSGNIETTSTSMGVTQSDGDFLARLYQSGADGVLDLNTGQATPVNRIRLHSYNDSYINPASGGLAVGKSTVTSGYKLDVDGAVQVSSDLVITAGQITVTNDDHNYLKIESAIAKEQMVRFKNSLTNNWYAGLRTSAGLATTADFHIYSTAYGNDVLALKTDGSMMLAAGATFNAETYVRDASNVGIRMQTTALGTGSSDGLRVGINSTEAFVWNFEELPLTFATSGTAKFQIASTGEANFYANSISSGNLLSSGYLRADSTASNRFGGDTYSSSVGMYDNTNSAYQTPVLVIRKDSTQTGNVSTAPVSLFIHNGVGKWVKLSLGARETNTAGNTVSIAGIASERTSGTVNAWATGNLHLWTKSASTQIINQTLKSNGDTEIPSGNFYVNGSAFGRSIRAVNRAELFINAVGTSNASEIFFGHGSGYNEANIRWGISDRGSTGTEAGLLNFYKGPALSGFVAVATLNANDNTFTVLNGYKVNGTTVIDGSRNIDAVNVQAAGGINLRRDLGPSTGISFYTPTYYNWQVYMAAAGATSCGANGNLTAPSGLAGVTSWALRSRMEGVSTYGWIWETGSSGGGGATATAKMSLQATTGNLQIAGSFTAGANITAYSDERLKDNIKTLDGSKVLEMRGVSFTKDGKAGSGVIAQELERTAPELVEDDGTYKSVAYGNLVGYLIENAKQQQSEIDELKALVKKLMEK